MPVHVGQAEVPAGVAVGELLVIEAHELEDGRLQVVNMDLVLDGLEAKLVGGADRLAALDAAAGQPDAEAVVVVVPAVDPGVGNSTTGVRPNSPPQMISVSSNKPSRFKSLISAAIALSHWPASWR